MREGEEHHKNLTGMIFIARGEKDSTETKLEREGER